MSDFVSDDEEGSSDEDSLLNDSAYEYSEYSTESSSDSYVYPWPTSSDDTWASMSSDDCIQKILMKLPTYDPMSSDDQKKESPNPSDFSDHGDDSCNEKSEPPPPNEAAPFDVEKLIPFVELFRMPLHPDDVQGYAGDDEDEKKGGDVSNIPNRLHRQDMEPEQAQTAPASTPSPTGHGSGSRSGSGSAADDEGEDEKSGAYRSQLERPEPPPLAEQDSNELSSANPTPRPEDKEAAQEPPSVTVSQSMQSQQSVDVSDEEEEGMHPLDRLAMGLSGLIECTSESEERNTPSAKRDGENPTPIFKPSQSGSHSSDGAAREAEDMVWDATITIPPRDAPGGKPRIKPGSKSVGTTPVTGPVRAAREIEEFNRAVEQAVAEKVGEADVGAKDDEDPSPTRLKAHTVTRTVTSPTDSLSDLEERRDPISPPISIAAATRMHAREKARELPTPDGSAGGAGAGGSAKRISIKIDPLQEPESPLVGKPSKPKGAQTTRPAKQSGRASAKVPGSERPGRKQSGKGARSKSVSMNIAPMGPGAKEKSPSPQPSSRKGSNKDQGGSFNARRGRAQSRGSVKDSGPAPALARTRSDKKGGRNKLQTPRKPGKQRSATPRAGSGRRGGHAKKTKSVSALPGRDDRGGRNRSRSRSGVHSRSKSRKNSRVLRGARMDKHGKVRHRWRKKRMRGGDKVVVKGPPKLVGYLRFVGKVEGKGVLYGVEVKPGEGEHNGTVDGKEYFKCPEGAGLLVPKKHVRPYRVPGSVLRKRKKKRHNAGLMGGGVYHGLFAERLKYARVEYKRAEKKLGPREMGRIKYIGGDDLYKDELKDTGDFLQERVSSRPRNSVTSPVVKKLGPRDEKAPVGWEPAKYDLKPKRKSRKQDKKRESKKEKKAGPRDMKAPKGWTPANYKIDDDGAGFLAERTRKRSTITQEKVRKAGPRDVGRNTYKGPDWDKEKRKNGKN